MTPLTKREVERIIRMVRRRMSSDTHFRDPYNRGEKSDICKWIREAIAQISKGLMRQERMCTFCNKNMLSP